MKKKALISYLLRIGSAMSNWQSNASSKDIQISEALSSWFIAALWKSAVMKTYFSNVMGAEKTLFGDLGFMPSNVRSLCLRGGDLNLITPNELGPALDATNLCASTHLHDR